MIYVPAKDANDWKQFLAEPDKQWKDGYSAVSLAKSWQNSNGFPKKVEQVLKSYSKGIFKSATMIFGFPEYKVGIPGGKRASQNDIFVLARTDTELLPIMVEGKVDETFGPLVSEWKKEMSEGKEERFNYLCNLLNIAGLNINDIRYQLLHRTASAILTAQKYHCEKSIVLIHSFSASNKSFDDYSSFLSLYNLAGQENQLVGPIKLSGVLTYFGWIKDI